MGNAITAFHAAPMELEVFEGTLTINMAPLTELT
jgi:hypothetical protein